MKYVLDFDRTLFDSDSFVNKVLGDGKGGMLITPGIWNFYDVRDFLYPDVLPFLESKKKEDVIILSATTPSLGPKASAFQKEKIQRGNFEKLVGDSIVMEGDKGPYLKKLYTGKALVFVDDSIEQLESARDMCPDVIGVRMVRTSLEGSLDQERASFPVIHSLDKLDAMIDTL